MPSSSRQCPHPPGCSRHESCGPATSRKPFTVMLRLAGTHSMLTDTSPGNSFRVLPRKFGIRT